MNRDDILAQLRQIKYDLSVTQTRVGQAIEAVTSLPAEPNPDARCDPCQLTLRGPLALAEHRYLHHDGPVPDHYLAAERHDPVLAELQQAT